ncbi:hypothetical protein I3843_14G001000 [Carya illinoinensis]|uniref:Uncharacterized protein n=1 Tax=Carya illinoinensis TaxID=32201 RepID=A0A922DC60_CARIL|nr:hypothetical protein I3760_14G001300 [Carya illinoinensis]KAG6676885.1 hypothetical protein I3842_14G001300 [Carya illinoinensis]KAG7945653.1 hypothetical protein I3843_14G001000 [Carya illinoinensis]
MVLQLFFTLAFSAVPLTLYVPPIRSLNFFVETMEDLLRESRIYTDRIYPRARVVWSRLLDCVLCSDMRVLRFALVAIFAVPKWLHVTIWQFDKSKWKGKGLGQTTSTLEDLGGMALKKHSRSLLWTFGEGRLS